MSVAPPPFCVDCAHSVMAFREGDWACCCVHSGVGETYDVVSGKRRLTLCAAARRSTALCGGQGRYWAPRVSRWRRVLSRLRGAVGW